jgi:ATP-dependent Clp protease ATP-binding subunit ClpA
VLERFTEKSIEALNRAQEEAKKLGLPVVGTDQILVGIMQADNGLAGKVLGDVHGKIKQAQREVEKIISASSTTTPQPEIPLTPSAKKF